ncbi:5-formyltetrahydrofolate cyclo-ligase, partial [Lysobacter sp. D1-1-M9]|uniref:5-formyltetrahydrofolate cyclo-ligase n=1 Tax=Novilysobacter longmucuonensis TaxID=3098603 RepID=UPI003202070C
MTTGSRIARAPLRDMLRERRRSIAPPARIAAAQSLARRLLSLPFDVPPGPVAGYWALDGEIALHAWQLGLPPESVYCLPVLTGDTLSFAPWRPGEKLASNRYGIPEPDVPSGELLPPSAM